MTLAAGYGEEEDPPQFYHVDVLTHPNHDAAELTLVERYVGTLLAVDKMQEVEEFCATFGEYARTIRYLGIPADEGVSRVFQLCKRHARQICGVLEQVISRESPDILRRTYPGTSLLSVACGRAPGPAPQAVDAGGGKDITDGSKLVADRSTFSIRCGPLELFLGNTKEFELFERLSQSPGVYLSLDTLREDVWDDEGTQKNTIAKTASNLRRRLKEAGITNVIIDGSQEEHYTLKFS